MTKEKEINKEYLDDAITILGKAYNSPKQHHIESAIQALRKSTQAEGGSSVVRADEVSSESSSEFVTLGVPWADDWLRGGLRRQELVLVGAIPHAGKTHLLSWFGIQLLLEGHKVLYVVGEDLIADVKAYFEKGIVDTEAFKNLWFANMQDVTFGVPQVEQGYEFLKQSGNDVIATIVDHVDLMKGSSGKQDWEQVTDVLVGLKMFAKRTDTIVITASQLTYDKDSKGNARFYRAKVGKAANADIILMVDDVVENEYLMSLTKARGRKKLSSEQRQKSLLVNWDTMDIGDMTGY